MLGLETYLSVTGLVRAYADRERQKEAERQRNTASKSRGMAWRK